MSKVMAVNAGSSSLKFQLFEMPEEKVLVAGNIERIGMEDAIVTFKFNGTKKKDIMPILDHNVAVDILLKGLIENGIVKSLDEINGVGHRVVQGGAIFKKSESVNEQVAKDVEDLAELAPLHNKANINGYKVKDIIETKRIGIDYAEEYALKPWRFYIKDNIFISKK